MSSSSMSEVALRQQFNKYIAIVVDYSWIFCVLSLFGSTATMNVPTVKLSDCKEMPIVGFGTHFRKPTQEEEVLTSALEAGYRSFDTAFAYRNEVAVGKALKKWMDKGGKREDLFITTKLPPHGLRASDVEQFLMLSLKNLGLSYVDLYLIHVPFGFEMKDGPDNMAFGNLKVDNTTDLVAVWKAMENEVKAGRVKSIGLSNFNESQIISVYNSAKIKPSALEIELNIYLQQEGLRLLCHVLNIAVIAYSPLGSNDFDLRPLPTDPLPIPVQHPVVCDIAEKHGKTPAQILLRYSVGKGITVIPNSSNSVRMRENLQLFEFTLTLDDMTRLKELDQHGKVRKFHFRMWPGVPEHPEYPFENNIK